VDSSGRERCCTHRQIARHPTKESNLEDGNLRTLGDPFHRPIYPISISNVLRIQLVLRLPIQRSEPSELQRPHEISQQCALLDCADHRRLRLWLRVGLFWPPPDHTSSVRVGRAVDAYLCSLGRRIFLSDDIHSQACKSRHRICKDGLVDKWLHRSNVLVHLLWLLRCSLADVRLLVSLCCYHVIHWQILIFCRFMGAMTNNGRKLANFAGFYK